MWSAFFLKAFGRTACCAAVDSMPDHLRVQALEAAARRAGGARRARTRTMSDKRLRVSVPATSDLHSKDEEALAAAALQFRVRCVLAALGHAQGDPVMGLTSAASQLRARHWGDAPYTTRSRRRRSDVGTPGADVRQPRLVDNVSLRSHTASTLRARLARPASLCVCSEGVVAPGV